MMTGIVRLKSIHASAVAAVCLLIGSLLVCVVPGLDQRRRIARRTLRTMFRLGGIEYCIEGLDQLPDGPCLVIANHRSYLDGPLLMAALPPRFTPVIKQDMADIFFMGRVLRRVGSRFVVREPAMQAGRDTTKLLQALRDGESLMVFPEGTLSANDTLLPFHGGGFFVAAKAGVAVVPAAIDGTPDVLPDKSVMLRPGRVRVRFLTPSYPDGVDRAAGNRLRDRAQATLTAGLKPTALSPRSAASE